MNLFNRDRKLFEQSKPKTQNIVTPVIQPSSEVTKRQLTQEGASLRPAQERALSPAKGRAAKNQAAKRGTVIFTNQANLFTPQELDDFFAQISFLIHGEKRYGRSKTPETVQTHYEQGLSVIGASEYQVWGHVCLCPVVREMYVLEVVIRSDFRNTTVAKQLVDLFVHRESHQEKNIYALSWTPYTKRLFRELAWVPCRLAEMDVKILEALKTYDEFVEHYDIFSRHPFRQGEINQ